MVRHLGVQDDLPSQRCKCSLKVRLDRDHIPVATHVDGGAGDTQTAINTRPAHRNRRWWLQCIYMACECMQHDSIAETDDQQLALLAGHDIVDVPRAPSTEPI